jgi:GntR family transcriptional regulator
MLLNLSDTSTETLQGQLARQVRGLILGGDLEPGTELPSIRSLASEQKVSVVTVQRAYEALEREGLIQARRGRGFFVQALTQADRRALALARLSESLVPVVEQAAAEGLSNEDILRRVAAILEGVPT